MNKIHAAKVTGIGAAIITQLQNIVVSFTPFELSATGGRYGRSQISVDLPFAVMTGVATVMTGAAIIMTANGLFFT